MAPALGVWADVVRELVLTDISWPLSASCGVLLMHLV
jgi:hypothetical protein